MTAPRSESAADRNREELRLALAMRGGVSLAVWIGGAVSEIERMRRDQHPTYQALLKLGGYRPQVIVDVLSGASAGGLNGAVYAACQVYGMDIFDLRDLWIRIGDIEALSRAATSGHRAEDGARRMSRAVTDARDVRSRARRPPSLLDGDGYFYVQLRDELRRLYARRTDQDIPIAERVELVLTATLFEPVRTTVRLNRSTTIEDQRSSAQFRFRHGLVRTDFHPGEDGRREEALGRLAMAARTTSSFPFAFEPASIGVGLTAERRTEVVDGLDFTGTFEAPRPPGDAAPQAVIDGGVLDNIPVTAAIRAVAEAPADGRTARRLVYMHPSPPSITQAGSDTQPEPLPAGEGRASARKPSTLRERIAGLGSPRAIKAGIRTLGARFGQESLLADIDELALVNDVAERRRLALEAVFGEYLDGVDLCTDSVERLRENVERRVTELDKVRADVCAGRVLDALQHPEALGAGLPSMSRRTLDRLEAAASRPLRAVICEALCAASDDRDGAVWRSSVCLDEAALLLVSWARDIERWAAADPGGGDADDDSMGAAGPLKASGYRARAIVELMEQRELARWAGSAGRLRAGASADIEAWAADQAADTPWMVPSEVAGQVGAALKSDEEFGPFVRALSGPQPEHGVDLRPALWAQMVQLAERLGATGLHRTPAPERRPATVPYRILEQVAADAQRPGRMEIALASVTRLVVPLQLVGSSENRIEFVQLSGRAPTPLQQRFETLLDQRRDITAREAERALAAADHRLVDSPLPAGGLGDNDPLRPADKLCGDELGNFAAFLSAKWRANDWMWGRLDSAATIVDLLVSPERLAAGVDDADAAVETARAAVIEPAPDMPEPGAWRTHFEETIWKPSGLEARLRAAYGSGDEQQRAEAAAALQEAVVTRLHEEILAAELPVVFDTGHAPPADDWQPPAPVGPDDLERRIAAYDTGLERPKALGDRRRVGMGMRLGLVAFGALRPDGASPVAVLGRSIVSLLKPVYLAVVFFALSVRRGLFVTAVAAAALQATFWQRADTWQAPNAAQWVAFLAALGVLALGSWWGAKDARDARERRRRRSEWPGRLQVVGGAVAAAIVLNVLWAAGPRYAVLFLAALAMACAAAWLWREQRRQGRAGTLREQVWFPATIAVALAGIVFGGVLQREDRPVQDLPVETAWQSFRPAALLLGGAAVVVAVAGTSWMRRWHRVGAIALMAGVYLGVAAPFRTEDGAGEWPVAVRALTIVAAISVVAALAALAAADAVRRERAVGSRSWRLWLRAALTVALPVAVAALLATRHVSWPAGVWATLSIVIAAYTLTLYATFADVLNPRPGGTRRMEEVTVAELAAAQAEVPADVPIAAGSPAS